MRWGIVGPGRIAATFAAAISTVADGEIVAVASRSRTRAKSFAHEHGVPRSYGDYRALVDDPDVEVVYVATPHSRHMDDTLLCLEGGKHVLCEKPLAINATQARRMASAAAEHDRFLMEAMWSRFLPAYRAIAQILGDGRVGEPQLVEADFGFRAPFDPSHRLFDPALGSGALLDLGIYPLQLCSMVFGKPTEQVARATVGTTGVDEAVAAVLVHPGQGLGVIKAATRVSMTCTARIAGTEGVIELPAAMHCPRFIELSIGGTSERIDTDFGPAGFRFEIEEVHRCIARGATESSVMPLAESIELAGTMDDIRAQIGVTYPGE